MQAPNYHDELEWIIRHYSTVSRFNQKPLATRSAVLIQVVSLHRLGETLSEDAIREDAERFLAPQDLLPLHRALLTAANPPLAFRSWEGLHLWALRQAIWQRRIYFSALDLHQRGGLARGTDELARKVGQELVQAIPGLEYLGPLTTSTFPRGRGRPPAIEVSVACPNGVVLAIDGKDPIRVDSVAKIAADCGAARTAHPEYRIIQPVLLLPAGCDVRSQEVLQLALERRVFIAPTALVTRPLGLCG